MENKTKVISASDYFENIKGNILDASIEDLKKSYPTFLRLAQKYKTLGQTRALSKLSFISSTLSKQEKLIQMGITKFVYRDTIEDYIDHVAKNVAKIIELKNYVREIPDELVEVVENTKDIFDEFYVVFTDYTGKEERRVEKERREKDPILFGAFKNSNVILERFYVLGDWIDEYCDLTMDKMISEYEQTKSKKFPLLEDKIPQTPEELTKMMESYVEVNEEKPHPITEYLLVPNESPTQEEKPKSSPFSKVKAWFKR